MAVDLSAFMACDLTGCGHLAGFFNRSLLPVGFCGIALCKLRFHYWKRGV
jgi:hypothetical protein